MAATAAHAVEQQPNIHVAVATGPARTNLGVLATLNNTKTNTMMMEGLFIVRCWLSKKSDPNTSSDKVNVNVHSYLSCSLN